MGQDTWNALQVLACSKKRKKVPQSDALFFCWDVRIPQYRSFVNFLLFREQILGKQIKEHLCRICWSPRPRLKENASDTEFCVIQYQIVL